MFATFGDDDRAISTSTCPASSAAASACGRSGGTRRPTSARRRSARFAPNTVVRPDYVPPDGEVDLLLSTDVLSEGQNLQQAQAVISYDMPWNPQRVVQRNGRVIRLLSPHDEVLLTTMLPEPGELEELLGLEARIQAKIRAAGVYGMESEVIEGTSTTSCAPTPTGWPAATPSCSTRPRTSRARSWASSCGGSSSARCARARSHASLGCRGESGRLSGRRRRALRGPPGVFFATRTRPMAGAETGRSATGATSSSAARSWSTRDLEILRRIDPDRRRAPAGRSTSVDLERAWEVAAADIVAAHNARADPRAGRRRSARASAGRWTCSRPGVTFPVGADEAEEALSVGRSSAVRRALGLIESTRSGQFNHAGRSGCEIVSVVADFGLRGVRAPDLAVPITSDELGVVCWMPVLGPPAQ